MKIVLAPDSFKESMSAFDATYAMKKGIKRYDSSIETQSVPLADGGEGTLQTLVEAMGGTIQYEEVTGPLFKKIKAPIGYVGETAIIECAKVCGLELLKEEEKDPHMTTTYGLGELISIAMNRDVKHIMVCLGGSATNDGGIGMLAALGVHFYDCFQKEIPLTMEGLSSLASIDCSQFSLPQIDIIGVCDVKNPLCGPSGATFVYGPQKGVKAQEISSIDRYMHHYALLSKNILKNDFQNNEGAGAAGGLGFALMAYCKAQLESGFNVVSKMTHLEEKIKEADIVFVGEGKMDKQTQYGKTPYGVLQIALNYNKKVVGFAGKLEDKDILREVGFSSLYQITPASLELAEALKEGKNNLEECVYQHMKEIIYDL